MGCDVQFDPQAYSNKVIGHLSVEQNNNTSITIISVPLESAAGGTATVGELCKADCQSSYDDKVVDDSSAPHTMYSTAAFLFPLGRCLSSGGGVGTMTSWKPPSRRASRPI